MRNKEIVAHSLSRQGGFVSLGHKPGKLANQKKGSYVVQSYRGIYGVEFPSSTYLVLAVLLWTVNKGTIEIYALRKPVTLQNLEGEAWWYIVLVLQIGSRCAFYITLMHLLVIFNDYMLTLMMIF